VCQVRVSSLCVIHIRTIRDDVVDDRNEVREAQNANNSTCVMQHTYESVTSRTYEKIMKQVCEVQGEDNNPRIMSCTFESCRKYMRHLTHPNPVRERAAAELCQEYMNA